MRVLLLFRGAPGVGKSTFIEKNGLKPFALSADEIRLMYSSPTLQVDGSEAINQSNDKAVWNTLYHILEARMERGEFTVIDATNSKTAEMNKYKELASTYRYRIYCIDMTDVPIEEVKRRNANREPLKRVPDEVIDKMYSGFETQQIPPGIKVLKPDELDTIWYKSMDLSAYDKIHVIGDIHGCYTVLKEYINSVGGVNSNECYIFSGDYVDRGIENAELLNYLFTFCKEKNVFFLEGNHEKSLWLYANDVNSKSKEFEFTTKQQLDKARIDKKELREFYRKLGQCCYFKYHDKVFLVTHGGVSNIPDNLIMIPTEQMRRGVGTYNESDEVDRSFVVNTENNVYQIHGHRNVLGSPVQTAERTYNLEGDVEFGGHLRVVQITKDGITPVEVKNNVFREREKQQEEAVVAEKVNMSVYDLVGAMRNNKHILEKRFDNISSFNFTRTAFEKGVWDGITNKARGLFIDTDTYDVAARGYPKFFNINELPECKLENLKYKFKFPVTAYVKENGFLGIVGWDKSKDDLLICSKSSPVSEFAEYMRNALYNVYGNDVVERMKDYIKEHNSSFVFECCDPVHDPHIIEYQRTRVVLLDVIKNDVEFNKLSYNDLVLVAENIGLSVKEKAYEILTWEDFFAWYNAVTVDDYMYNGQNVEGFVIEDSDGYMVKLKLHYYKMWKRLRSMAHSVLQSGHYKYTGSLLTPIENEFYGYCKSLFMTMKSDDRKELRQRVDTDICSLRREFFKWRESN